METNNFKNKKANIYRYCDIWKSDNYKEIYNYKESNTEKWYELMYYISVPEWLSLCSLKCSTCEKPLPHSSH